MSFLGQSRYFRHADISSRLDRQHLLSIDTHDKREDTIPTLKLKPYFGPRDTGLILIFDSSMDLGGKKLDLNVIKF